MAKTLQRIFLLFCVIFTLATLASCFLNLSWGLATDTYAHILDRAALSLMGAAVFVVLLEAPFTSQLLRFLLPYAVFMPLALLYLFLKGFFVELHPNAYRDLFLNDTAAYLVIYALFRLYQKVRKERM